MKDIKNMKSNRADAVLAVPLLLAAAALFFAGRALAGQETGAELRLRAYRNGELVLDTALTEESRRELISEDGGKNILVIREGAACVESADCPGQDCVKTGRISQPGQEIVCLPHKLVIRIEGGEGEVDALAR